MRRYQHKPDQAWIERRFAFHKEGVEVVRRTVERSGRQRGKVSVFDTAIDTVFQAVSHGWAFGEGASSSLQGRGLGRAFGADGDSPEVTPSRRSLCVLLIDNP